MPRINKKSRQYLFKNNINIRRKSKRELKQESFSMFLFGLFLLLVNYFIPQKLELFNSTQKNVFYIYKNLLEILIYSFEIFIVLFICFTVVLSIFLFLGSFNRLIKIMLFKPRKFR